MPSNNPPHGFGAKPTTQIKSDLERLKDNQKKAIDDLRSAIPVERLQHSVPIDYDEYGIPKIEESHMPQSDNESLHEQFRRWQEQQAQQFHAAGPTQPAQPSLEEIQAVFGVRQQPTSPSKMDAATFFGSQPQSPQPSSQPKSPPIPQNPRQEVKEATANKKDNLQYHPVIKKLLKTFGIKKDKRHSIEIYVEDSDEKMVYTMTLVPEELQSWALDLAKEKINLDGTSTATIYFELLFVCCAIVAIDHQPVYDIFAIEPTASEKERIAQDPLDISLRMRKVAAANLIEIFWSQTRPIGDKLLSFYTEVVADKKIISSLDTDASSRVRYVCPIDNCDHYEFITPKPNTSYFCKFHGTPLVETVDVKKELDLPLA